MTEKWVKYVAKNVWRENYQEIELPSELIEQLDFTPGEDYVYVELREEPIESEDESEEDELEEPEEESVEEEDESLFYIYGEKSAEKLGTTTDGYYDLRDNGTIQFPKRMRKHFPEEIDQLGFEINPDEDYFRIYNPIDFALHRSQELDNQGYDIGPGKTIALGIPSGALAQTKGAIDLASYTQYPGQKVRIIPVEPDFEPLVDEAENPGFGGGVSVTSEDVAKISEAYSLPATEIDKIGIRWIQELSSDGDLEKLRTTEKNIASYLVVDDLDRNEVELILPKKGGFAIWGQQANSPGYNWLLYDEAELDNPQKGVKANSEWICKYCNPSKSDESCITLYFPLPNEKKGEPRIHWPQL